MIDIGCKYYFFGSHDSLDLDVMVDHELASGKDDSNLERTLKAEYPAVSHWNIKIIRIVDHQIVNASRSKGSPDSSHNCLFDTYHLHAQVFPFPLKERVPRILILQVVKCVRTALSFFRHTKYHDFYTLFLRPAIVSCNWERRMKLFNKLHFQRGLFDDQEREIKTLKSIAFYIGQTISLLHGVDIYTKADLKKYHPELVPIIDREAVMAHPLLKSKIRELSELIAALNIRPVDWRTIQCQGLKVDLRNELVVD